MRQKEFIMALDRQFIEDLIDAMTPEQLLGQTNLLTFGDYAVTGSDTNKNINEKIARGDGGGFFNVGSLDVLRKIQEQVMTTSPVINVKGQNVRIPSFFWGDYLRGYSTIFPPGLGMSATRDTDLIERVARASALESTANGIMGTYAPMCDTANDPRWGRVVESPGESTWWNARVVEALVNGYLGDDAESVERLQPTLKHFMGYGAVEAGREYNKTNISTQELLEKHLPPFEAGLKAGAKSVMMAFHTIDGIPCTVHEDLYKILRKHDENLLIVSDFSATRESTTQGHGLGDLQTVARRALKAGLDMFMVDEAGVSQLGNLLRKDRVLMEKARDAARNVLLMKMEMGLFNDPYRFFDQEKAADFANRQSHKDLALEAVESACVLLKNDESTFPLPRNARVAVVGPLADDAVHMIGSALDADKKRTNTVRSCMEDLAEDPSLVRYAAGCNLTDDKILAAQLDPSGTIIRPADENTAAAMRAEAVQAASQSDYIVAVVGAARDEDGESCSKTTLDLPQSQKLLLRDLAATGKPLFLWVVSGRPLALTEEEKLATAIAWTTNAGSQAGMGMARLTYGLSDFSGRLPMTFPLSAAQCPIYLEQENSGRPTPLLKSETNTFSPAGWPGERMYAKWFNSSFKPDGTGNGRGEVEPLYWAGHGLSYAQFEYGAPEVDTAKPSGHQALTVSVKVTNAFNSVAARAVTQLYLTDPVAKISRPVLMLRGVQKTGLLQPGESETAQFTITPDDFAYITKARSLLDFKKVCEAGELIISTGPTPYALQSVSVDWKKPKLG